MIIETLTPEITETYNINPDYLTVLDSRLKSGSSCKAVMFEMLIFSKFNEYVAVHTGNYKEEWRVVDLSNGGFYFCPAEEKMYPVTVGPGLAQMSNHQVGMALTYDILASLVKRTGDQSFQEALEALKNYVYEDYRTYALEVVKSYLYYANHVEIGG